MMNPSRPPPLAAGVVAALSDAVISNCSAASGGAVALNGGGSLSVAASSFVGNSATNGGVFYLEYASASPWVQPPALSLRNVSAVGNAAALSGGLFFTDASALPSPACAGCVLANAALNGADTLAAAPAGFAVSATAVSASTLPLANPPVGRVPEVGVAVPVSMLHAPVVGSAVAPGQVVRWMLPRVRHGWTARATYTF
jgi:hypothetical protein